MQKYSKLFGKTRREAKKDMKFASHKLLYRAGFIRELAAGRLEFLPLGYRVWSNIIKLIDSEMTAIGSQRMAIPLLQPIEFWKKTNRDEAWKGLLMTVEDSKGAEFALSATGEAVVTEMVGAEQPSYKDLPIIIHQTIAKFRDEKRPRGGLLRAREFVMKDAYSYHADEKDFMKTYQDFYEAYSSICKRLELPFYAVIADNGALGGDYSHEFQIPSKSGEDRIVKCTKCDYAANIEMAEFVKEEINKNEEIKELEITDQKWEEAQSIKQMTEFYKRPESNMIKTVAFKRKDGRLVLAVLTGNLEVNSSKLAKAVGESELEKAEKKDLDNIGAIAGALHAWGYEEHADKITYVVDESIVKSKNLYGGNKTKTTDPKFVNYGRDFKHKIEADIADPGEGSICTKCGGKLSLIKSIELGHIFKYDHFYTEKHNGYFVNKEGNKKLMFSGAYGIGIGRTLATTVEIHNDEMGIIWPKSITPFHIHFVTLAEDNNKQAGEVIKKIENEGFEVLWDERDTGAGEKFADADLIGLPIRVVLSKRSLEAGGYEVKLRSEKESKILKEEDLIEFIKAFYS
ncbi:proline--tRNA ligase [bacterium]|nr:proline--tRNA ligase [bacterium]